MEHIHRWTRPGTQVNAPPSKKSQRCDCGTLRFVSRGTLFYMLQNGDVIPAGSPQPESVKDYWACRALFLVTEHKDGVDPALKEAMLAQVATTPLADFDRIDEEPWPTVYTGKAHGPDRRAELVAAGVLRPVRRLAVGYAIGFLYVLFMIALITWLFS